MRWCCGWTDGRELRYHDAEDMGKIYLTLDLGQVPTFMELGPEANDPDLTLDIFLQRLRRHPGEIKGILTNQEFVAGIGNAYADEICWRAGIYPFRRRPSLDADELARLYAAMRSVLADAIDTLRVRVGDAIDVEVRDFLAVHGRPGQPCPPLRQPHQRGVARAARHALLPDVPAGADGGQGMRENERCVSRRIARSWDA